MAKIKILVTGSSGTIGTRLCERLLADKKYQVYGADWKPNKWQKSVQKITTIIDLRQRAAVLRRLPKVDLVIHLAANARVYDLVVDPDRAFDNLATTYNILEYARRRGVPRVFFASSREVYGNTVHAKHAEDDVVLAHCESPYTASKMGGEALMQAYRRCYGIETVIFRFSNVYGMYDESDRVVPLFIRRLRAGKEIKVFGREKKLDFTYIDDTVTGIMRAIAAGKKINGQTFNLASGVSTSIATVAEMLKKALGARAKISFTKNRTGEVVRYTADITRAHKILGYQPRVDIRAGLRRSLEWYVPRT